MKKIFSIFVACAMTVAASAQIVSSSSRSIVTEAKEFPNYSRVFVSYAPMSFSGDASKGKNNPFNDTAEGFVFGWQGGWSISKTMPVYVETGLNLKYNYWSNEETDPEVDGDWLTLHYNKESMSFLSMNVPVNISYKYSISGVEGLSIVPYIGLHLTGNLIGKLSWEDGYTEYYDDDLIDSDMEDGDGSFFDEDDMGGSDYTANRIQLGWQIGVGLNYKRVHIGVGYSAEFTEYMKKLNTGGITLTLGLNF